jgi:hypothetical protein
MPANPHFSKHNSQPANPNSPDLATPTTNETETAITPVVETVSEYLITEKTDEHLYERLSERLSAEERQRLHQYELLIHNNLMEIGLALMDIKDSRLYRETHSSFEEYVRDRYNMSKTHAYGKIAAAQVIKNLEGTTELLPQNERQCRPLASLAPQLQRQAWQEVVATNTDRITHKSITKIAAKYKSPLKSAKPQSEAKVKAKSQNQLTHQFDVQFTLIDPLNQPNQLASFDPATSFNQVTIDINASDRNDSYGLQPNYANYNLTTQPANQENEQIDNSSNIQQVSQQNIQPASNLKFLHARIQLKSLSPQQRHQEQIKQQQRLRKQMETLFQRCTPAMSKLVQHNLELYLYQFAPEQELDSCL